MSAAFIMVGSMIATTYVSMSIYYTNHTMPDPDDETSDEELLRDYFTDCARRKPKKCKNIRTWLKNHAKED